MRQVENVTFPSPFHTSYSPAKANGSPDRSVKKWGVFFLPTVAHP